MGLFTNLSRCSLLACATLAFFLSAPTHAAKGDIYLDKLNLPEGFQIEVYAQDIPNARHMTLSDSGTLFVGSRGEGKVYAVLDKDGDQKADEVKVIAEGLKHPTGVALKDGDLYVSATTSILRFDDIEANLDNPPKPVTITNQFLQSFSNHTI